MAPSTTRISDRRYSRGFQRRLARGRSSARSAADSRFAARTSKGVTPLVGRVDEIGMMQQRWARAVDGDGQVILLSAPAGMGKSRMTQAFRESLGEVAPTCIQFFCSPYHTNSPLYPFMRQLELAAGLERGDSADRKLDKLEGALAGPADAVAEAGPLLAALLSIPYTQRYPQLETIMSELVRKQRTMHVHRGATGPPFGTRSGAGGLRG